MLKDVVTWLVSKGFVTGDGIDAFRDYTPDKPDKIVVVCEYPGIAPGVFQPSAIRSMQLTCRDASYDSAKDTCHAIYHAMFDDGAIKDLTESRWAMMFPKQTPFKLIHDQEGRVTFCFNVSITTSID